MLRYFVILIFDSTYLFSVCVYPCHGIDEEVKRESSGVSSPLQPCGSQAKFTSLAVSARTLL